MTREQLILLQLNEAHREIMLQVGSALFASISFLLLALAIPLVIANYRKSALVLSSLAMGSAFLVPTPVTMWVAPPAFIISIAGCLIIRGQEKRAIRAEVAR